MPPMKTISNIAYVGFAALLACGGCSSPCDRAYRTRAGEMVLPERALWNEERAREFLAHVERADDSFSEEDLMSALLVLMGKDSYWMTDGRSGRQLVRRLIASLMAHPAWTHRYDGFLRHYASTLPGDDEYPRRSAVREAFGLPAKRTKATDADFPLDGTWLDWLRPAAEKWSDRLTWQELSLSSVGGVGWFKEPPEYPLPVKGRIHCLVRRTVYAGSPGDRKPRPRYGVIFKFDTLEDLKAAVVTFNGGLDERLYGAIPNLFHLPGAQIPDCFIMTYSDDASACHLLSVSSFWSWDNSTWEFLPNEVVPRGRQKGKR